MHSCAIASAAKTELKAADRLQRVVANSIDKLQADSPGRIKQKLRQIQLPAETVIRRLKDLQDNQQYHATAIQKVIDEQMETIAAQQMNAGGGGKTVLESALNVLLRVCRP